jgi:hypothetical protein
MNTRRYIPEDSTKNKDDKKFIHFEMALEGRGHAARVRENRNA